MSACCGSAAVCLQGELSWQLMVHHPRLPHQSCCKHDLHTVLESPVLVCLQHEPLKRGGPGQQGASTLLAHLQGEPTSRGVPAAVAGLNSTLQGEPSSESQGVTHCACPSAGRAKRATAGIRSFNWHDQDAAGQDMGGQRCCAGPGRGLRSGFQHQHSLPAAVLARRLQGGWRAQGLQRSCLPAAHLGEEPQRGACSKLCSNAARQHCIFVKSLEVRVWGRGCNSTACWRRFSEGSKAGACGKLCSNAAGW